MSTANFKSMDNFPLYVFDMEFDEDENTVAIEASWDDWRWFEGRMIEREMDEFNESLKFHKVSLESGHYAGVQFYVEDMEKMDEYPDDYTNSECRYLFDMCRSEAFRKYHSEQNKIRKWLKKKAKEYDFMELGILGRFSNGEVVYCKV